jgi:hypothetical protein
MKAWLRKVGLGLKIAEKVAVMAGDHGLTIQGRNPAEIDAIAHTAASAVIGALRKPKLVVGTTGE